MRSTETRSVTTNHIVVSNLDALLFLYVANYKIHLSAYKLYFNGIFHFFQRYNSIALYNKFKFT